MRLLLDGIQHVRMITHEGKVLLVGIRKSGQLVYTIRRDGFEDDTEERQLDAWENWQPLPLPGVEGKDDDPSVHAREAKENVRQHADGTPLLDDEGELQYLTRSLYDSHRSHQVAPIAVVSGMGHVHVFRVLRDPDPEGVVRPLPLLVDRFVLDGMANRLVPKLDLRFRRSRQRYEPLPSGPGSALVVDSLDFRDANDKPFTESTTQIGFVDGRTGFSVELAPAGEPDRFNWHFATTDWRSSGQVTLTSVRAGEHGGFDLADGADRSAIVRRVFGLSGYRIDGVPALQRFDRQAERRTASGETQWLRVATSLMLAVPVVPDAQDGNGDDPTRMVGTVQLPLRADGSLAPTAGESGKAETRLRGRERAVALAPDTLLRARAVSISEKRGAVGVLRRGEGGAIEIVAATSGDEDRDEPLEATAAVELELDGTPALDGVHVARGVELGKITRELRVGRKATYLAVRLQQGLPKGSRLRLGEHGFVTTTRDLRAGLRMLNLEVTDIGAPAGTPVFLADSFAITPPEGGLGTWQDASADAAARFDGQVLGISMDEGRLIVHAPGHGLTDGDEVEIKGTRVFDGKHSAVRREDAFTLDRRWPASEAVNLKQQRVPRRGLVLGSGSTRILVDHGGLVDTDKDTTIEAWVRTTGDGVLLGWFSRAAEAARAGASDGIGEGMWLAISDGRLTLRAPDVPAVDGIADRRSVVDGQWHHVAAVLAEGVPERTVTFLVDGEASAPMTLSSPLPSSRRNARLVMGARDADDVDALGAQGAELSEVRLWQRALTAEQLGEHLHRPVHHGSRDLVAFWRLGAVFDGDPPQVVDATIGRNDGDVIGPAWPTPVAIPRIMADGVTPVSRVENPALFGVAQGGVYREELQFRFRGSAGEVQFYLWGQASRSNSERVELDADDVGTQVSDPDEHGWATASVRFRVPDGVTLVRSVGIGVGGDWSALELRRHRVVFQESTTHESFVASDLALTKVGKDHAGAASLRRRYEGLHGKKRALDQRLARLEGLLRSAIEAAMLQSALAGLQIKKLSLEQDIERTAAAIRRWENDPLSYWMTLFVLDDKLPSGNAPVGALADDPNGRLLIAIDKSELGRDHAAGGPGEYMWRVELFFGDTQSSAHQPLPWTWPENTCRGEGPGLGSQPRARIRGARCGRQRGADLLESGHGILAAIRRSTGTVLRADTEVGLARAQVR